MGGHRQGLTLPRIQLGLGVKESSSGLTFVALSRVTSLSRSWTGEGKEVGREILQATGFNCVHVDYILYIFIEGILLFGPSRSCLAMAVTHALMPHVLPFALFLFRLGNEDGTGNGCCIGARCLDSETKTVGFNGLVDRRTGHQ